MLLVALDIEGCADLVVDVAGTLALDLGSELTLLTAVRIPAGVPAGTQLPGTNETVRDLALHEAEDALRALAAPWEAKGVSTQVRVEMGTPAPVVLAAVDKLKPRFLVLGTHGRVGVSRWVFGSVEESITRRCPVPVLVVPSPETINHHTPVHQALMAEQDG